MFKEFSHLSLKLWLIVTIDHVIEDICKWAVNLIKRVLSLHQILYNFPAERIYYSLHQDECLIFSSINEIWLGKTDNIARLHSLSEYCLSNILTTWEGQNKKLKRELVNFQMIIVHAQVFQAVFKGRSLVVYDD